MNSAQTETTGLLAQWFKSDFDEGLKEAAKFPGYCDEQKAAYAWRQACIKGANRAQQGVNALAKHLATHPEDF